MATLLLSDLHLSPAAPGVARALSAFLAGPARAADALYVLGDLFEYWAGDDDLAEPFNAAICGAFSALAKTGVPIFFMRGNRDFLVGETFAQASGMTLLDDPSVVDIAGTRTLLMHGDTLCTDDTAYQAFRAQVRNPAWQAQFLAQPLATRKRLIEGLREQSEMAKGEKPQDIMDVSPAAVQGALRAHRYPRLIHGHTHRPARHEHDVDGHRCERWVLADWCQAPAYLACDAQGCRAVLAPSC